jgi:hypothetical protein
MRPALSSAAVESTLLQRGVPEGSAEMVAMEGAAKISGDEVRQGEAD